ncbi:SpoIID/LytB domain-containing protein [bacterium]|nr:SpoIID/LytB domain-containing protein [bacterium]
MKKAIIFLFLMISTLIFSTSIRILIVKEPLIKLEFSTIKTIINGVHKTYYKGMIVSSNSKGITIFYNNKTQNYTQIDFKSNFVKINGKKYSGYFKIFRHAKRIYVVLTLEMEDYVRGVLPGEMPSNWPIEALKAQAILARTYGYYHLLQHKKYYDLGSDVNYQIFSGNVGISESVNKAVRSTRHLVLTYSDFPIVVFYHSTCGGMTESSDEVWGKGYPYLTPKECNYCYDSPHFNWEYTITMDKFIGILNKKKGTDFDYITDIQYKGKTRSERVRSFLFVNSDSDKKLEIKGNDFRMLMGPNKIKSLLITNVRIDGFEIKFEGRGFGHGVGMCQYGAKHLAEEKKNYIFILDFYFHGTTLKNIQ